jgi:hypothetical protein
MKLIFTLFVLLSNTCISQINCLGAFTFPNQNCSKIIIGNGTPGFIRICLESNNIPGVGTLCNPGGICNPPYNGGVARIAIHNSDGATHTGAALASWNSNTDIGTCYTVSNDNGYAAIFGLCLTGNTLITWFTVNGQGQDVCTDFLPVTLLSFTAERINNISNNIRIKWITASESNSSHFIVKKSIDASNYTELCKVNSVGTMFNTTYSCEDEIITTTYYLLEQHDIDGTIVTYKPIVYNFDINNGLIKYYNPLGVYMGEDFNKLDYGLYICVQDNNVYKILIK